MPPTKRPPEFAVGIDIGGTFTDIALLEPRSGQVLAGKVLTNYADLAGGVLRGVAELVARHGVPAARIRKLVHGTTLATNALIERRGARTALIVTRGFRDILEMARESRYDIFDIDLEVPAPLVPRHLAFEITERIDAAGKIVLPLVRDEIATIVREMRALRVTAAAVCLLHGFRNSVHEREIAAAIGEAAPEIAVSLSSDVMPDVREYERASTTVANAYVRPVVQSYLDLLADGLRASGIEAPLLLIASDGGTIGRAAALLYPVRLVESGPAGGALAAAHLGKQAGIADLVAFDMGGTTAKICVIDNGEPERSDGFEVARVHRFAKGSGLPLKVPVLEMIEIGAGGGSIAGVDELGLLRVGPESAGASPGPACYALGGDKPTVTDADLLLGYLDPDSFLGGAMRLDRARAEAAIRQHIAEPLGLSVTRAAWGMHAVVNDNMAHAAKVHCLERGKDPRDYTLLAYGGAGPVHAAQVGAALGIRQIFYPLRAGIASALGFLAAPASFERMRADTQPLGAVSSAHANGMLRALETEAMAMMRAVGVPPAECSVRREVALRFVNQSYALPVRLPSGRLSGAELSPLRQDFITAYRARYFRLNPDVPIETVSWRVVVRGPAPRLHLAAPPAPETPARKGARRVFFIEVGRYVESAVYHRYALRAGVRLRGPAVIEEPESTVVLGPGVSARLDAHGNILAALPRALAKAAA